MGLSENAMHIMQKLYMKRDKQGNLIEKEPAQMYERVAEFAVQSETDPNERAKLKKELLDLMTQQKFMFSSPTIFNAGTEFPLCSSCFVGKLNDDMYSIMKAATDTAITFKAGAGMGLNFGVLRPKGAPVGRGGTSSGPVSFMRLFNEVGETVKSGGVRRAAFMAMMDINHPDINDFISSKDFIGSLKLAYPHLEIPDQVIEQIRFGMRDVLAQYISDESILDNLVLTFQRTLFEPLSNMNISVAITDQFMQAVKEDKEFLLDRHKNLGIAPRVNARELFHRIAASAWRTADPGVWFIDRANRYDTVPSIGRIESTNPCGEQSLHAYTSCNLGSINLTKFISDGKFDIDEFRRTVMITTRALDNIIDLSAFPTEDFAIQTRQIRPIGLGFTGLAETLYLLQKPYNSEEGREFAGWVAANMTRTAIESSIEIAKIKGSFELFDLNKEALIKVVQEFYDDVDEKHRIADLISKYGIRNSNWTTLAPTGSISLILDSVTYSLEPQFALAYHKNLIDGGILTYIDPAFKQAVDNNPKIIDKVIENGGSCQAIPDIPDKIKRIFVVAHDIDYRDRLKMQAALQRYISNSISSTINLPNSVTIEEIEKLYMEAWEMGLKGVTIYRDGCKSFQPMTVIQKKKSDEKYSPPITTKKFKRPKKLTGEIIKTHTGNGTLYITVGLNEQNQPIEMFINISKHGSTTSSFAEALGRVISIALQNGVPAERISESLLGIIGDSPTWDNGKLIKSIPDAVGRVLKEYSERAERSKQTEESSLFDKHKVIDKMPVETEIDFSQPPSEIPGAVVCPKCGERTLVRTEDCVSCLSCGYSKCG